ncbi:MAG TPA: hypothetical protein VNT02_06280, partial [Burkholderiales bacterium]|nr:hypothetical protein [Burkholderiales bacterium]
MTQKHMRGWRAPGALLRCLASLWLVGLLATADARAQFTTLNAAAAKAPPVTLTQADAVVSASPVPPNDTANWQPITLPDNWYRSRPGFRGIVWYRVAFTVPPGGLFTHAVYLPRNSATQMTLWVNANRLSISGAYGDPRLTELQRPLIYTLPAIMLHPGTNHIYVQVKGEADFRHGLTRITVGYGAGVRRDHYEPRYDLQVTSTAIVGALLLLAGVLALLLWRADRKDPVLFWFGMTALASSVWSGHQLWSPDIAHSALRDVMLFGTKYLYATPLLVLCLRVGRIRNVRGEALLWALYLAGCAAAALVEVTVYPALATAALTLYVGLFATFL